MSPSRSADLLCPPWPRRMAPQRPLLCSRPPAPAAARRDLRPPNPNAMSPSIRRYRPLARRGAILPSPRRRRRAPPVRARRRPVANRLSPPSTASSADGTALAPLCKCLPPCLPRRLVHSAHHERHRSSSCCPTLTLVTMPTRRADVMSTVNSRASKTLPPDEMLQDWARRIERSCRE